MEYNILFDIGKNGEYDLLISNILTKQAGDPDFFMNVYFRTNKDGNTPENASGYSNPEYDALSEKLSGEFDPSKRRDIIIQMEKIMMNDAGIGVSENESGQQQKYCQCQYLSLRLLLGDQGYYTGQIMRQFEN